MKTLQYENEIERLTEFELVWTVIHLRTGAILFGKFYKWYPIQVVLFGKVRNESSLLDSFVIGRRKDVGTCTEIYFTEEDAQAEADKLNE